jgi:group I intron endonuclease
VSNPETKIYYYLYEVTNLVNGKTYIGQHITDDLEDGYMGGGLALGRAIKKYGKENFKKEVLIFARSAESLNLLEMMAVTLEFCERRDNYNLREGGGSKGRLCSETRKKISIAKSGPRNHNYGKKFSEETRSRMSKAQKGRIVPLEARLKHSAKMRGRKLSKEHREKLSRNSKRHKPSPQLLEKMKKLFGKPFAPIYNKRTGEIVRDGVNASGFARDRGLRQPNFVAMLKGRMPSCGGWALLQNSSVDKIADL